MPVRLRAAAAWCIRATCWCAFAVAFAAQAQTPAPVCKYIDAEGNIHYINVAPERGWKKLACDIGGDRSSSTRTSPTPAGFPRVDADTQRSRDDVRKKVLTDELATEEKLLAESKQAYGDGAPPPLPEEQANAQRYAALLGKLRQAVALHEKNIEALHKELATLR